MSVFNDAPPGPTTRTRSPPLSVAVAGLSVSADLAGCAVSMPSRLESNPDRLHADRLPLVDFDASHVGPDLGTVSVGSTGGKLEMQRYARRVFRATSMATLTAEQIEELRAQRLHLVKRRARPRARHRPGRATSSRRSWIGWRTASRRAGKIGETYDGLPFEDRFIAVAAESPEPIIANFEIALPNGGFTAETPINCGPATFNFLRSPRILDLSSP